MVFSSSHKKLLLLVINVHWIEYAEFFEVINNCVLFQCRYIRAFFVYGGCNLVLAAAAAAICAYIAPAAAGSGIPEVKAYLNGVDAYSILAPSTLFVKVSFDL